MLEQVKCKPRYITIVLRALNNDNEIDGKFNIEINHMFNTLFYLDIYFQDAIDQWELLKKSAMQAADTTISKLKKMDRRKGRRQIKTNAREQKQHN